MASLNQIAERIAFRLGDPTNYLLIQNLKFSIKYWRAVLIRRDSERNLLSPQYFQSFTTKLKLVDSADSCAVQVGCNLNRTIDKIPMPIRLNNSFDFKYVGEADGKKGYTYTEFDENEFAKYNKYTGNIIRYNYTNGYIYLFGGNANKLKWIRISLAAENPNEAIDYCINSINCFTDDDDFVTPGDIIFAIVEGVVKGELEVRSNVPDQVTLNTQTPTNGSPQKASN